jgi:hypothetical protein
VGNCHVILIFCGSERSTEVRDTGTEDAIRERDSLGIGCGVRTVQSG